MAKSSKRASPSKKEASKGGPDPLKPAIDAFAKGDYIEARRKLDEKTKDPELSDAQREAAKSLISAMGIEKGTLMVGLACLVLLLTVIVVTTFSQP